MSTIETESPQLLPTRQVCKRYGVSDRTIARWERDPDLRFPQPVLINQRKYANQLGGFSVSKALSGGMHPLTTRAWV
jgi:predicted DNA-binding transcriptional regulator AlpA